MKKADKIKMFKDAIGTYNYCRCYFRYDPNYFYFYPVGISDKLLFGILEDDFILDGFQIKRISDLTKIELKDDLCVQINKDNKILDNIEIPSVDLNTWNSVFNSLIKMNNIIIIEAEELDDSNNLFTIGRIINNDKSEVVFKEFGADGVWEEDLLYIPYKYIISVTFSSRYCNEWEKYFNKQIDSSRNSDL